MKYLKNLGFAVLFAVLFATVANAANTLVHFEQGGSQLSVQNGGKIDVISGGELELSSGSTLDMQGTMNIPSTGIILGSDNQVLKFVDVTVTTGQLLALNATPKSLVPAPGAGLVNIFVGAFMHYDYNSAAYGGIHADENLQISYTNGSGAAVAVIETANFLDQTADELRYVQPAAATEVEVVANAALVLSLLVGEITTGNSPLKLRVFYKVIPAAL